MSESYSSQEPTFLDYLAIFVKWRKLILINVFVLCVLTAIIVLIIPKWYKSTATILTPQNPFNLLGLSSLIGSMPIGSEMAGLGLSLLPQGEDTLTYLAILNSRNLKELIIDRFNLDVLYNEDDRERTIKALERNIDIEVNKEGTVSVITYAKTPQRAADMANAFVYFLDSINVELNIQKARNNRIFIERRYIQNKVDLAHAEEVLKTHQEQYGIIEMTSQMETAVVEAATLKLTETATEIKLHFFENSLSPTHSKVATIRRELSAVRTKLNDLYYGKDGEDRKAYRDPFSIPFSEIPEIGLAYFRLLRNVEIQNAIHELLVQQYELAKIKEARDIPTVQVLDIGKVPIRKAKPHRTLIVILAGFLSLTITSIYVFTREYIDRTKSMGGKQAERITWIQEQIQDEIRRLRRR
jgi:uncharacterized protein involved in exopolysaccharide biosynthesis